MKKKKSIELVNTIKNLIIKKNLLQPNESLLVAFSGGQDSMILLIVFFLLKKQWNLKLHLLYCNHLWQQNTFYVYLHISKISFCLNIELLYSITLNNLPTEEESRTWRSKNYYRLTEFSNCSTLFTGHTLTDQIETFFFNLIRGSSLNGSSSLKLKKKFYNLTENDFFISQNELYYFFFSKEKIVKTKIKNKTIFYKKEKIIFNNPKNNRLIFSKKKFVIIKKKSFSLQLIRPLIIKTRFDTKNICKGWKLPLFPDKTNQDTKYSRNRLRKQVLPTFRFFFNPKVDLTLYRYLEITTQEDQYIEKLITKLIKKIINEDQNGYFFNLSCFSSLPFPLQRKICFSFFKKKLKIKHNFLLINSFVFFVNHFFLITKKEKKLKSKSTELVCIFFPEIGTLYFSKTFFIIFK